MNFPFLSSSSRTVVSAFFTVSDCVRLLVNLMDPDGVDLDMVWLGYPPHWPPDNHQAEALDLICLMNSVFKCKQSEQGLLRLKNRLPNLFQVVNSQIY